MIKVRDFRDVDLMDIKIQDEQKFESQIFGGELLSDTRWTVKTLLNERDEIMAIIGWYRKTPEMALVGAFMSDDIQPYLLSVKRKFEQLWLTNGYLRTEAIVRTGFEQGHRFIKLLGFEREGTMRKYIKGMDYDLYARLK